MRAVFVSLNIFVLLVALVALPQTQGYYTRPEEQCRPANCMSAEKCEELTRGNIKCKNPKDTCCSIVKTEFRNRCEHWGGECMKRCNERLVRQTNDCPGGERCCVLV